MNNANVGRGGTTQALLDGFHPALFASLIAAVLGVAVMALRRRPQVAPDVAEPELEYEAEAA